MRTHPRKSSSVPSSGGRVIAGGNPSHNHAVSLPPPALRDGQVRCPVCRNATRLTLGGSLRAHGDLFGHPCYNRRATDEPTGITAPEVTIPRDLPARPVDLGSSNDGRLRSPTGLCHECERPVTGERRFCGACLARRSR